LEVTDFPALSWPAPAKINLFLHVIGRRQDGFHNIQTLFQLLDWGDEIQIRPTPGPAISRAPANYGVEESQDLVVRAARLLQAVTGCRQGAEIEVKKRVPPGSGLGGGSSDAATVLLVLNRLWGCGLGLDELAGLGRTLGADVPVFIQGHSAMAAGIGDILEPVNLGERQYLLVFPGMTISTAQVFSDAELPRDSREISLAGALAGEGRNDCELVVRKRFPEFARVIEALREWGNPVMTGTGSAIFIAMNDRKSAKSAAKEMKTLYNVRAVRGVDRSTLRERLDSC
jgi:4-diphosphocytidyl-2-C-methyl-D-erythritol kinase